jgi:signal transduction histidine kinase
MLSQFLTTHRKTIIANSRAKVASRAAPRATPVELETGVPLFLDQLVATLRIQESTGAAPSDHQIGLSAAKHGSILQKIGFTAAQVIHDYGDVCQAITELAVNLDAPITADEFRTLNRCLDQAMAEAVSEFGPPRELSISDDETERLGFFAHELRNLLSNSMLAFEVLKGGSVGVGGSTSTVLGRNLTRMRDLIDRSLAEVRLKAGIKRRERVLLAEFIEEVEVAATIEAKARGLQLTVTPVPPEVLIEVDRQILAAAVANLLQNAFKFTRPGGHVLVRTHADADRVFIAIEDECGGLAGRPEDLFALFEQRSKDRSGLGLGLAIARQGVSANGGEINARNIAGRGCIFTVELPRLPLDAVGTLDAAEANALTVS